MQWHTGLNLNNDVSKIYNWVKALGVATFNLYSFFVAEALEVQNY